MEHTATYQRYHARAVRLLELRTAHGLPVEALKTYLDGMEHFQVVAPLVGEFSTGKSSLVNALLGRDILGVDLTPETAVPTEICYSREERAVVIDQQGGAETISIDDFQQREFSVETVHKVQLYLDNAFLQEISTVKIVDMPGFNSGVELHNRAIDEYLPDAQAYLLTFSARSSTISEDMAGFLKELHLHELPVFLLITKGKSVTEDELRASVERIRADAQKYLGLADVSIAVTNAKGREKNVTPLADDLRQIEKSSQAIFQKDAQAHLQQFGGDLALYLETAIKRADLTPNELDDKIEEARQKIDRLQGKLADAGSAFDKEVDASLANTRTRLQSALSEAAPSLEDMLMNRMNVQNKVSMIVRETVLAAIKEDFAPRVQRYRDRIASLVDVSFEFNGDISLRDDQVMMDNMTKEVVKRSLPAILSAIGIAVGGPIGAVITFALSIVVDIGFMKKQQAEQRRIAHEKIHNELIPSVVEKAMESVRAVLDEQVAAINEEIRTEVNAQVAAEEKALADLKQRSDSEKAERAQALAALQSDLADVRRIMNDAD